MVAPKHSTEWLSAFAVSSHGTNREIVLGEPIAQALVVPFGIIKLNVFTQGMIN